MGTASPNETGNNLHMKIPFSLSVRKKFKIYSRSQIVLFAILLVFINILVYPLRARLDLTDEKIFTLAPETKRIVENINDTVTISAFFSQNLPPELITVRQQLTDLLNEYGSLSDTITLNFRDPKSDDAAAKEARDFGIPEVQFNLLQQDQFQVTTGYLGISVQYHDKTETIPFIQDASNTEYDLTSALLKVTRTSDPKVAFSTGHDEIDTQSLRQVLARNSTIVDADLASGTMIDPSIHTLIIAGPKTAFDDRSIFVIDQFVMRGGKVLFFLDGVDVDNSLVAQKNASNLFPLLSHYGVNEKNNLVFDPSSHETLNFQSGLFSVLQPYPFWPRILKDFINQQEPLTRALETAVFGWASSLDPVGDISDRTFIPLLSTTPNSWSLDQEPFSLSPQSFPAESPQKQSFVLAGMLKGNFPSFFQDKDKPAAPENSAPDPAFLDHVEAGQIIVVADSDIISPQALEKYPENIVFAANAVDVLAQDESLISIRSRAAGNRPLQPLTPSQKALVKYGNIFGSVVLAIGFGFGIAYHRKYRGRKLQEKI